MTLTTHAIVGAATAQFFPNRPLAAFSAGFLSHFIIDSLPHWDYSLLSLKRDFNNHLNDDMILNKYFLIDLAKVGFDMCAGIILSILIFTKLDNSSFWLTFIGAAGGIAPDPFQFLYWKIRREPLTSLQRLHMWIQEKNAFEKRPLPGLLIQLIVISIAVYLTKI